MGIKEHLKTILTGKKTGTVIRKWRFSRSELLAAISSFTERKTKEKSEEGITLWALISGVVLIGAYLIKDFPSLSKCYKHFHCNGDVS